MLSKNKIKQIIALQKKKIRDERGLYIIEGDKLIKEYLMSGMHIRTLFAKPEFINSLPDGLNRNIDETEHASFDELKKISTLKTPHNAIAVVQIPEKQFDSNIILKDLCAALDFIQDPGNLGTVIRSASWFGIENIVCSDDCVDIYNPKVIQASMGAIMHVNVYYTDLQRFLAGAVEKGVPVYGTMTEGESIYSQALGKIGVILLGNESRGISDELLTYVSKRIMIPRLNNFRLGIDSLNVGMAASVIFSEFARR